MTQGAFLISTGEEAKHFAAMARRIAALVMLGPKLDVNYIGVTESPHQEQLFAS